MEPRKRHKWKGDACNKCNLHRFAKKEAPNFTWTTYKPTYTYAYYDKVLLAFLSTSKKTMPECV